MNNTTIIKTTCTACGSPAHLYTSGRYTGIWECQNPTCGASDVHDHDNIIREEAEAPIMNKGEFDTYDSYAYGCETCNMGLDFEAGERAY